MKTTQTNKKLLLMMILMLFAMMAHSQSTLPISVTIRDFKTDHVDFQIDPICGLVTGMVESTLGGDGFPVYVNGSSCIDSAESFYEWYHATPGVNMETQKILEFVEVSAGHYVYDNSNFFPINGELWGNQNGGKNYHFTMQMQATFTYLNGSVLEVEGDDDIWIFLDGILVVDLGGVHAQLGTVVDLDDWGFVDGETYSLDVFFAERHTVASVFIMNLLNIPIQQVCTAQDLENLSPGCNFRGYCVYGTVDTDLFGCSCLSGYYSSESGSCDNVSEIQSTCAGDVSPDTSLFDTTIGADFSEDGNIVLTIEAPIEELQIDGATNGATYTLIRFLNEDKCDYPEASNTDWTKIFDENSCTETYSGETTVPDFLNCIGTDDVTCEDDYGDNVENCDPDNCENPPCFRCYPGQVLSTRGYEKVSQSGSFSAFATAENCHYFEVCLPWIQRIDTNILVVDLPYFAEDFIITRVAFECFTTLVSPSECYENPEHDWIIVMKVTTHYPFYVEEAGNGTGALVTSSGSFDLVSIVDEYSPGDECGVEGNCYQTLTFTIPGCNALEVIDTYNISGLVYDCGVSQECIDAKDALGTLDVVAQAILQATQDNCGASVSLNGRNTLSLSMGSYLSNYIDENIVFVQGSEELGSAYFKITATSDIPLQSFSIIALDQEGTPLDYILSDCDIIDINHICFNISLDDILSEYVESDLVSVTITATLEASYEEARKRSIGLGQSFRLVKAISIVPEENKVLIEEEEDISPVNSFTLFLLFLTLF